MSLNIKNMNITSILKSRREIKQGKVLSGNLINLVKNFRKIKPKKSKSSKN